MKTHDDVFSNRAKHEKERYYEVNIDGLDIWHLEEETRKESLALCSYFFPVVVWLEEMNMFM